MTGWVKTHEKTRFSCCSHFPVLWWALCLLLKEKEAMYLFTKKRWGAENMAILEGGR